MMMMMMMMMAAMTTNQRTFQLQPALLDFFSCLRIILLFAHRYYHMITKFGYTCIYQHCIALEQSMCLIFITHVWHTYDISFFLAGTYQTVTCSQKFITCYHLLSSIITHYHMYTLIVVFPYWGFLFLKRVVSPNHHFFNRMFHCKASTFCAPHFQKTATQDRAPKITKSR